MAEKSPVWNEEKKDAAAAGRYYIKAGDKRGKLFLSGAKAKWKNDPTFTYVPTIRVAGTPSDITALLVSLGNTASVARQYVESGYTAASAASEEFLAELADLKAFKASGAGSPKKRASASGAAAPVGSIAWYAQKVEDAKVQGTKPKSPKKKAAKKSPKKAKKAKKAAKKSPKKAAKKSPKKTAKKTKTKSKSPKKAKASPKRGPKPLSEKIAALKAGKVMDVTKYRASGDGAKSIDAPGDRSKKVVVGKIAANAQDGLVGVKAAAKALGNAKLVDQWKAAKAALAARSPKKSKSKSPKGRKASPKKAAKKASPAAALPLSPSSPRGLPALSPRGSPRGSKLPSLPVVRPPTIGSPVRSPRI